MADMEKVRKYAPLAAAFAEAMGRDEDVTITQLYGPDIVGRPVRRERASVMSEAGLRLIVLLPGGGERDIHLADVKAIRRAE